MQAKATSRPPGPGGHRVAIYVRVSSDMQAKQGYSLDTQVDLCLKHCAGNFGSSGFTHTMFREEGRSGQKRPRQMGAKGGEERPVVSELVDCLEAGEYTDVVCYEVTRSGRDLYFWTWFKQEICEANGVSLRFVVGNLNCDDEDDGFFADMQALLGHREARMTGRRIRDGRHRALEKGYWPHGQNPWGWQREPGAHLPPGQRRRLVPVPERAKLLVHMKDRLLVDGWGCRRIAKEVHEMGGPSGATCRTWTAIDVHRRLTNPVHAGYVEDAEGNLVEGVHKPDALWDLDTYYQILTVLDARRPNIADRHRSEDFPLGGVLTCGQCGRFLRAYRSSQTGHRFYRCDSAENGEARDCPGVMKRAECVEACVVAAIRDFAGAPKIKQLVGEEAHQLLSSRQGELRAERKAVAQQLAEKDGELEKFADAFGKGLMNEAQFGKVSARWQEQEAALKGRLAELDRRIEHGATDERLLEMVRAALERFDQTWDRLDGLSRRELLSGLLEELSLRREDSEIACRVKLHILPATEFRMPGGVGGNLEVDGVGRFTPRQLAFLAHVLDGLDFKQIADIFETNLSGVYGIARRVETAAGSKDLQGIARAAAPLIEESRPWLPLEGRVMDEGRPRRVSLSPRQIDVLTGHAEGRNRSEIAESLGIKPTTVSVRMCEIRQRLGTTGIPDSIQEARRLGLLEA